MARAFILIMDSFGVGGAKDAENYGDLGANTLGHIAEHFDKHLKPLQIPNMARLGLINAAELACGEIPSGMMAIQAPQGIFGALDECSRGKDTPSGHWEIAGQPVMFDWGYFPNKVPTFPEELRQKICAYLGIDDILANCHGSGTDMLTIYGEEHVRTGKPICYTSADSVLQIAAHEETFGLQKLYDLCAFVRAEIMDLNIGRVIARPFIGSDKNDFTRTGNRKDYSVLPPNPTLLDIAKDAGRDVFSIGKIADIYANQGITQAQKANGNMALFDETLTAAQNAPDGSIIMTNFVDFDMLYGHRRDILGYGEALEAFDARLPELFDVLQEKDMVIITADHGCDPSWSGTDHTRERVPILAFGPNVSPKNIGVRSSFADIGASVATYLSLPATKFGESFL
ncbi:MAG: phosphopentomutase [Rhizobiaceae bacterium]|nr:phosphopentomutase [Rhizobiaceae bacterium]